MGLNLVMGLKPGLECKPGPGLKDLELGLMWGLELGVLGVLGGPGLGLGLVSGLEPDWGSRPGPGPICDAVMELQRL